MRSKYHRSQAPKRLQVLLAPEWYVHEINLGVAQYAHEHHWILHDSLAHTTHRPPENLQVDGIITLLSYPDHFITQKIVAEATVPVVDLNGDLPEIKLPRVLSDNALIGRLAAEHLIGQGFRLLVYYQTSNAVVDEERRDGFQCAVENAGREFRLVSAVEAYRDAHTLRHRLAWMSQEFLKLPTPFGIMSQFDGTANEVSIACGNARLRIPDDVAIVGVDNDPIAAELGPVPLSSVDSNRRAIGYQGAALLDQLMSGEPAPAAPLRVPPKGLIVRKSTDILMVESPSVAAALRHISEHFREDLHADAIARAAGVSRRSLYRVFQENVGRSMAEEIERRRVFFARQMLANPELKVSDVAQESGFVSSGRMSAAFVKHFGKLPSQCRG